MGKTLPKAPMSVLAKSSTAEIIKVKPNQEVALLYCKEGESYWVRGYEFFDPSLEHSTRAGSQGLKIKKTRLGCVWLIMQGQQGKPVQYDESRIAIVRSGKHYFTFQEVFGSTDGTGSVVINAEIDRDDDDLTMGLTVEVDEGEI